MEIHLITFVIKNSVNATSVMNVNTAIRKHCLNCIVLIVMVHKSISTATVSLFQDIVLLYLQCKRLFGRVYLRELVFCVMEFILMSTHKLIPQTERRAAVMWRSVKGP